MHKLIEFICDELEELERKADKDGKLSMAEIQYGDTLAHFKKNLLKAEEMSDGEGYSGRMYPYGRSYDDGRSYDGGRSYGDGRSYARRRDSRGRYSRNGGYSMAGSDMVAELHELMKEAPDDRTRMEFQKFIDKIEAM